MKEIFKKISINDDELISLFEKYCNKFGIKGEDTLYLIANCYHESGGFKRVVENLNYSEDALKNTFSYFRNNPLEAKKYARNQEAIANRAYANRIGNGDVLSGDGWKFRGRGFVQLTGRDLYKKYSNLLGYDFIKNPDAVAQKEYAVATSCLFYKENVLNKAKSIEDSRRLINGTKALGLKEVKEMYNKIKQN